MNKRGKHKQTREDGRIKKSCVSHLGKGTSVLARGEKTRSESSKNSNIKIWPIEPGQIGPVRLKQQKREEASSNSQPTRDGEWIHNGVKEEGRAGNEGVGLIGVVVVRKKEKKNQQTHLFSTKEVGRIQR